MSNNHSAPTPADVIAKCDAGYHSWHHRMVIPAPTPRTRLIVCIVCGVEVELPCDENGKVIRHDD